MINTGRSKVYDAFLRGENRIEAIESTGFSSSTVCNYFCEFEIGQIRTEAKEKENRMLQIRTIENELFKAIKLGYKTKIINQLQNSYVKFQL